MSKKSRHEYLGDFKSKIFELYKPAVKKNYCQIHQNDSTDHHPAEEGEESKQQIDQMENIVQFLGFNEVKMEDDDLEQLRDYILREILEGEERRKETRKRTKLKKTMKKQKTMRRRATKEAEAAEEE